MDQIVELALGAITPGDNDRQEFAEGPLVELAQSIAKYGLAQPITVRRLNGVALAGMEEPDRYQIVAGERRWRAHQLYTARVEAGEWKASKKVKTGFIRSIVRVLSDEEASGIMLAENDQREDLNPMERAQAYQSRIDQFGWSVEQLAKTVNKNVRTVRAYLDLLRLEDFVQQAVRNGSLPTGHARLMAPLDADRQRLAMRLLNKGERVTFDMFREYVAQLLDEQSQQSMFNLTDFWVEQVNQAEAQRQGIDYDLPTSDELPPVVVERNDNTSRVIRRYIEDLEAAGCISEAAAVGNLMTMLLKRRKIKS